MADFTPLNPLNVETIPSSVAADQKSFSVPSTFLTQAEIEDFAVKLAMSGIPLDEGLIKFDLAQKTKLDALEEECRSRKAMFSKWIAELNERIKNYKNQHHDSRQRQADLRTTKFTINVAIQALHLKEASIRLEARVKQLEGEKQFFDDETRRLSEKEELIKQRITQDKDNELQYAKQLHASLLEVWHIDEAELNRRAELLEDEQQHAKHLLERVEEKIRYLREMGITRTTAGFLLWVGYTAFAGVGSLIGGLLQQRQKDPSAADLLGNFIRGFAEFFGLSRGTIFSWGPFLKMLSFVGAVLLFVAATTILCDLLLRLFSRRWKKSNVEKRARTQVRKAAQGWKEVLTLFTSGADRLSLFTGKITRADYVQLLAVIPYIALASLLLFLLSALGLTIPVPKTNASAEATITAASIGAVFTLLSTSACLLYATKVIEPRWERLVAGDPKAARTWTYVKANWEFGLLMFVMLSVVLLLTFLPLTERNNYWTWGLVALFMTVGSLGLAYGLIYRGIFRDHDHLARRHNDYLVRIEELVLKPTLTDVFEATDSQELENSAHKYRKAREYLEALRIENNMNGIFGEGHPEYEKTFSQLWFEDLHPQNSPGDSFDLPQRGRRKLFQLIRRLGWKRPAPLTPLAWWRVAPEAMEQLKAYEEEIARYQSQLQDIDGQITELEQECVGTAAKIGTARQELRDHEAQLWNIESECASKVREHGLQRQREEVIFTSAFLIGRFVHMYLTKQVPEFPLKEQKYEQRV